MARDFTDILNAVWAANALTTIPNPPIPGQAYRNTEIDDSNLENGQQYSEVYDSARYNQLLYLLSGCLKMLMETGLPEWSAEQNYQKGAYTVGSDGKLYGPAKAASGPDNGGAVDPVTDAAGDRTTWQGSLPKFAPQFAIENKELGIIGNAPYSNTGSIDDYKLPGTYRLGVAVTNLPVAITNTSMLVVYGTGNANTSNVPLDVVQVFIAELANNATQLWVRVGTPSNTWGTWTRQDAGSLKPFVAPTQSSPGKQGLVPAPQATMPAKQPLYTLGPNAAFNTLTAGSFDVSWERANSTNIVLGAELVASPASIASITYAGDFYANRWSDAPDGYQGEGVYSLREMGNMGNARDTTRIQYSFFYALNSQKIYWRGGTTKRAAGQPMTWRDWMQVAGGGGGSSQPGTVFYFGGTSAPQGSLPCNGAAVSRTTYAKLFAAIGTIGGAGDGRTTFNVPNLASRVMRSTDFSVYPVGTLQVEGLPNIAGTFGTDSWGGGVYVSGAFYDTGQRGGGDDNNGKSQSPRLGFSAQNSNGLYGAAAGVQPYGALLLPCIVY